MSRSHKQIELSESPSPVESHRGKRLSNLNRKSQMAAEFLQKEHFKNAMNSEYSNSNQSIVQTITQLVNENKRTLMHYLIGLFVLWFIVIVWFKPQYCYSQTADLTTNNYASSNFRRQQMMSQFPKLSNQIQVFKAIKLCLILAFGSLIIILITVTKCPNMKKSLFSCSNDFCSI